MPLFVVFGLMQAGSAIIDFATSARNARLRSARPDSSDPTHPDGDDTHLLGNHTIHSTKQRDGTDHNMIEMSTLPSRNAEDIVLEVPGQEQDNTDVPETDDSTRNSTRARVFMRGGASLGRDDMDMGTCLRCLQTRTLPQFRTRYSQLCLTCEIERTQKRQMKEIEQEAKRQEKANAQEWKRQDKLMRRENKQQQEANRQEQKRREKELRAQYHVGEEERIEQEARSLSQAHPRWPNWRSKMQARVIIVKRRGMDVKRELNRSPPPEYETAPSPQAFLLR